MSGRADGARPPSEPGDGPAPRVHEPAPTDPLRHEQRRARRPVGAAPLRRSRSDRRLAGIAGGVAAFTGADPRWVRALFVVSVPLSLGVTAAGYLLLWGLLPGERPA